MGGGGVVQGHPPASTLPLTDRGALAARLDGVSLVARGTPMGTVEG